MPSGHKNISSNNPEHAADSSGIDAHITASEFPTALEQGQRTIDTYSQHGGDNIVPAHSLSSHFESQTIEFSMNLKALGGYLVNLGDELEGESKKIYDEYLSSERQATITPGEIADIGVELTRAGLPIIVNSEELEVSLPKNRIEPSYVKATINNGNFTEVDIDWKVLASTLRSYHDVIERVRPDINQGLDEALQQTLTPNPLQTLANSIEAYLESGLKDKFIPEEILQEVPVYW